MRGQVVYMYAYDVAHEIDLKKARESLAQAEFLRVKPDKTVPRDFPFYEPLYLDRGPLQLKSSVGEITLRRGLKIFSVGAISIDICVEFDCAGLNELTKYHSVKFADGKDLDDIAGGLCEEILPSLKSSANRLAADKGDPEAYIVFCLERGVPKTEGRTAQQWLEEWRAEVAGLLTEEETFDRLSDSEIQETTKYNYSYLADDLIVVDWDSALILDPGGKYEDLLYALEVANVQLTEFQVYDQILERFLERAYVDVERYSKSKPLFKGPSAVLDRLKGMLIDLNKISDELGNITKFFGDWHQARVYMGCSERFHLKDWERSIEKRLKTLDGLYKMIAQDINERRMLLLEVAITVLFVIDLLMIFIKH